MLAKLKFPHYYNYIQGASHQRSSVVLSCTWATSVQKCSNKVSLCLYVQCVHACMHEMYVEPGEREDVCSLHQTSGNAIFTSEPYKQSSCTFLLIFCKLARKWLSHWNTTVAMTVTLMILSNTCNAMWNVTLHWQLMFTCVIEIVLHVQVTWSN